MTTLRTAAQQALEAMDRYQVKRQDFDKFADEIAALRAALTEPVQEPVATVVARQYDDGTYAGNALDWAGRGCENDFPIGTNFYTAPPQRPAEPVQEPVAYAVGRTLHWHEGKGVNDAQLYLAPPQRKPLTDEAVQELSRTMVKGDKSVNWLCRAIEAAHGIGGEE